MEKDNNKAVAWLSGAHLLSDTYAGFLNPIMPFIAAKLGISMAIATMIISASHFFSSFLQPIFGFFADNILKRSFVFWGLIFSSTFISLAPIAPNVALLVLCIILGSLGGSVYHPQAFSFVAKFSKNNFARNIGIFISMGSIGFSFGPIIAGSLAEFGGLNKFPYMAILGVLTAFLMFMCVPKLSNVEIKPKTIGFFESFGKILSDFNMNILIGVSVMKSLITNSSCILFPFLWKDMGYSPFFIGCALFAFVFVGGIASLVSHKVEKIFGAKKVFLFSLIGTFPLMLAFLFTYKAFPVLSFVIFVLMGWTTMLAMPVTMVIAQKLMPDYKSIVSGFINGFSWGIAAIALTINGFLAQKFGIAQTLAVIAVIPVLFSYFVKHLPFEKLENS